jgi:hypothetical protein
VDVAKTRNMLNPSAGREVYFIFRMYVPMIRALLAVLLLESKGL